ncbi:uncharacterized protein PRCAT00003594001 [Priceomyces carsonii]|uniref:uncharacterized protein n=1 Tax=Priceomyces carsonii TaxID=28549 RepID=UPI002EDACE81|nr:unnamed protein product [Priceomyces carsonii]
MTSTVSYANVAAKGTNPVDKSMELSSETMSAFDSSNLVDTSSNVLYLVKSPNSGNNSDTTLSASNQETGDSDDIPLSSKSIPVNEGKKEKKSLAPAPVPEKSVWGSNGLPPKDALSSVNVDEHKWPTPDKVNQLEGQNQNRSQLQKFIKPITNKWVPISAKVVLPNARNNGQKQNRNRKNKKQSNGGNTNVNSTTSVSQNQTSSRKQNGGVKNNNKNAPNGNHDHQSPQSDQKSVNSFSAGNANRGVPILDVPNDLVFNGSENSAYIQYQQFQQPPYQPIQQGQFPQQQYQEASKPRYNANGSLSGFGKNNYRRYNVATNTPQQYKQRFHVGSQLPSQNGFYHPQPLVQGQGFPNFNNQFRQNQFRPQGYPQMSGYANGSFGFPTPEVQIPPPISPKQEPQEALKQQIDYYFSLENLIRDVYLRKNMDESHGWVSLPFILNFKRVKIIINGIQNSIDNKEIDADSIVLDSILKCENLEINYINDKSVDTATVDDIQLRVKGNFRQWLLPNDA